MGSPRWRKVLRGIVKAKTRSALVVLSIAVGVFAIGTIAGARTILSRDLAASYTSAQVAHATLHTTESFDDELVQVVRRMPQVAAVEGRRSLLVRLNVGQEEWRNLRLVAIANFADMQVNKVQHVGGAWPPAERTLVIERGSLQSQFGLSQPGVGQQIRIRTGTDTERDIQISGIAYDLTQAPSLFTGVANGYITLDTLEWLGAPRDFNELHLTFAGVSGKQQFQAMAERVRDKVENSGRPVEQMVLPEPGEHPLDELIAPVLLLLGVLSVLALLLSGFLVVNTISALLTQETRQIGVMKAIGARTHQIMGMYIVTVLLYGLLALVVALPLGLIGARGLSALLADLLGFAIADYTVPLWVFGVEAVVALVVPLVAAFVPIMSGTRITVRAALDAQGMSQRGISRISRALGSLRAFPRPLMLSLRNTFRRRGRLLLTLTTLVLSGAIFIAVMSVRASMLLTLDDVMNYWQQDVWVDLDRAYRVDELRHEAEQVPGVSRIEGWGFNTAARRIRPDDSESSNIRVIAPPAATELIQPMILSGRWLVTDDENAAVITTDLLKDEPDLAAGDRLLLKINGRESVWHIVGIVQGTRADPTVYVNYPYFALETRSVGRASSMTVVTERHDGQFQADVAKALERRFERKSIGVATIDTNTDIRSRAEFQFNILIVLLSCMALLLALVGGLGLMGTMSINVLDRSREIGVMRAIGGSRGAILRIVLVEGVLIGLMSWILGALLAVPLSKLLCDAVGAAFWQGPLNYIYAFNGALFWLAFVSVLAACASVLPAWNATRISVLAVLAYE